MIKDNEIQDELFRPCAVIPVYNHHQQLGKVVASLKELGLHCILVNDGSDATTCHELDKLAESDSSIQLFHLSWNQGKGSAVMEGLMQAQKAGFTHAVQIDADGQHDSKALPALLGQARSYPDALITGAPVYDESAPKSRLYGRKITRFWVCIETLSTEIEDAMIGFRVYPLDSTCQLIQSIDISRRMDFDIEIIVRLFWQGVSVKSVPVSIDYPDDGISHFNALSDNIRISLLHSRLFFGMLKRLPQLLSFRSKRQNTDNWSNLQERGSEFGIRFLLKTYNLLGHKAFSLMLMPVMAYFFLTGRSARKASRDYLEKLYAVSPEALGRKPDSKLSFKHFSAFGHNLADRFAAWSGKITLDHLDIQGSEHFEEKLNQQQGVVLLVSHSGNIEICRALANLKKDGTPLPVNVLVHTHHAPGFNKVMQEVNPDSNIRLIQVADIGPDTSIMLSEMIERGEIVAIAADRVPAHSDSNASISASFLGHKALFPKGPFILSSILGCPVYTVSCTRQGKQKFLLDIQPFGDPLKLPRKQRAEMLDQYVQEYAHRLEQTCLRSPLEWFNFFDFWQKSGVDQ